MPADFNVQEQAFLEEVTKAICASLDEKGVKRAELARRLGVSRERVTQVLKGRNITLRTLFDIAEALGCKPVITLVEKNG